MSDHGERRTTHEWTFRIGEAFPASDPLARFVVAVARALNDSNLSNTRFVEAEEPYELLYFFSLASSHLYEAAETFRRARREWREVDEFIGQLDAVHREAFERVAALADEPATPWPGNRLKTLRNAFFHYLRLDRSAADAGRLPLARGLSEAAEIEGRVIIETPATLHGIRALFADEVAVKTLTADFDEGELERLVGALANHQADLNTFAQAALGRYLRELPDGVVEQDEAEDA